MAQHKLQKVNVLVLKRKRTRGKENNQYHILCLEEYQIWKHGLQQKKEKGEQILTSRESH